ncbi:hypothetical protein PPTG_23764 [Phytophthora nicotianae INRA-310]|uniref:Uncharacterized protein n=1 Tax=Phytophthora nicotianae (strain INRA-310) TaxID=761204 RepID=W2PRT5_PHYN3|nr:hypothetical protein PPTG_23764 [Phytophthora nicotianae INRA-310]ETN03642.1 hypothetical protein PPTG_23764 [Phytophthora nicotianae INRA-310]
MTTLADSGRHGRDWRKHAVFHPITNTTPSPIQLERKRHRNRGRGAPVFRTEVHTTEKRKENAGAAHACLGRPQAGGGGALRNEQQSDSSRDTPRTFNKVR